MSQMSTSESPANNWLGLASNCLGLVKAIADSTVQGNSLSQAARTFFQWLAHERISEEDYETVAIKTSHLMSINDNGILLLEKIRKKSDGKSSIAGIPLTTAGSVGRAIASAPTHSYMITTAASVSGSATSPPYFTCSFSGSL
ncbi:hypothetical protein EV356DRAFT_498277 [Viridothelium virens]|uniref:Uncharacterized protein n=1 Tax=Viridothelium virens TaxID=1048519 RepID=A0A6A6GSF2_VIRVR|nr:hypothetical protein EV356DRAFT_498277 [Viridothelium virens]